MHHCEPFGRIAHRSGAGRAPATVDGALELGRARQLAHEFCRDLLRLRRQRRQQRLRGPQASGWRSFIDTAKPTRKPTSRAARATSATSVGKSVNPCARV
jgi:hypothetical protein